MYADDTVIHCGHVNNKTVRKMLQRDLCNVQKWCSTNRLTLNAGKTKFMTFVSDHKRKQNMGFKFYLSGSLVEEVENYRYLGTEIDNRINGDAQCTKLLQTLGYKIRTFGKIRRYLSEKGALTVFKSTILPPIDYNDHFQMLWNADKLGRLQKIQNWGLRIVYGNRYGKLSEEALHSKANLQLPKYRRVMHLLSIMYHRSKVPDLLDNRDMRTRQYDKIKFKVITPVVKKSFKIPNYLGGRLWDMLPLDTQCAESFNAYKIKVKKLTAEGLFNRV